MIMTACSAIEAETWKSNFSQAIATQSSAVGCGRSNVVQLHSPLAKEMRSIGAAFGKPGSFVRRMSVHRSQTVGPTTDLNQVIIKNTQAVKDALNNASSGTLHSLPRSQSVATPSHVQTLAPRRSDRVRLESLLADVWSPKLPYPGVTIRRTEQLKGSANHVIRKLSMASITSTFYPSKRTGSHTSMTKLHRDAESSSRAGPSSGRVVARENVRPARLPLSELLPADFDLREQPSKQKRRNALRALTMTMDRPSSSLLGSTAEQLSTLQRARSVREAHCDNRAERRDAPHMDVIRERAIPQTSQPEPCRISSHFSDHSQSAAAVPVVASINDSGYDISSGIPGLMESTPKKVKSKGRLRRLFG